MPTLSALAAPPTGSITPEARGHPRDRRGRARRRELLADIMVVGVWASAAVAVSLYLLTGAMLAWSTPADLVTALGILAGLIGTDFVLVMLVLAARIPIVDRTVGHDRAMALHRTLGKPALYLLLAHGALLILGYGMSAGINPIAETVQLWAVPDMPLAFVGMALMVIVVVSSLLAVRRRFSYELWHVIHLLSYLSVLVAVPHQLSVGGVFAGGTVERAYWLALYTVAFGSIGIFRFVSPTVRSIRHGFRVDRVEHLAPGVTSIHLRGADVGALEAAGGQFFIWRFWTRKTWWHSHPISLSAVPTSTTARITVRDLGAGSQRLGALPRGTRVSLEGPYGVFTDAVRTSPRLAIMAAGIGVTPVRALLEQSDLMPGEATIVLRASDWETAYLWDEIVELAAEKGARLYSLIGPRSRTGSTWMSAEDAARGVTMRSMFPQLAESDLYICGPTPWLDEVVAEVSTMGIHPRQLHTERFDW